jgi:hypothetical protein
MSQEVSFDAYTQEGYNLAIKIVEKVEEYMKQEYDLELETEKLMKYINSNLESKSSKTPKKSSSSKSEKLEKKICEANTKAGKRCAQKAKDDSIFCSRHSDNQTVPKKDDKRPPNLSGSAQKKTMTQEEKKSEEEKKREVLAKRKEALLKKQQEKKPEEKKPEPEPEEIIVDDIEEDLEEGEEQESIPVTELIKQEPASEEVQKKSNELKNRLNVLKAKSKK